MLAKAMHNDNSLAALVLLDPFGMQVDWNSIEQLKGTRTDLWILIPTGVIVNRLLDRKCELTHAEKLTSFFGKDEDFLRDYFYKRKKVDTLFAEAFRPMTDARKQAYHKRTENANLSAIFFCAFRKKSARP